MALRPIIETCEPRTDVLQGGLTDAHFAAQLDQVVRDPTRYPVYGDPTSFFAITYPTEGLKALLASTFGRLSGKAGKVQGAEHGVVRFQTSFGGGKTHGLIAAYHLASGARTPSIGEFVDPDLLPDDCRVAAVVGDTLDASVGVEIGSHKVQTMWGAIAAQLGDDSWAAVEHQDSTRTAPGTDIWKAIFEATPTLVIIDEVAEHLRKLSASGDSKLRRQAEAMPSFLFSLFTAAAQVPTARVVITLATAADAFGKETAEVEKVLDEGTEAGKDARSVIGRFREILVPAQDEEISAIIRRRLFSTVDDKAAQEAAAAFKEYYSSLEKRQAGVELAADFEARMVASYPLHPELINVLDKRVGTIPAFNRTRGALRLLAETVGSLWDNKAQASVINVADLPLAADSVASALTRAIDREAFAQVLEADVAGTTSHAAGVDKSRFAGTKPYATRSATTVFLHSLEQTASRGATRADVMRGTLAPDDDPDLIEEALVQLDHSAWHLDYDGARWRFDTEPNPRKIIEDEKNAIPKSRVREELDSRINKLFAPHGPIKTRVFPNGPEALDDRAELQLGVLHYETVAITSRNASPPPHQLIEMLDNAGVSKGNRTFRNGVVFLVADSDQIESMREAVRWDLAAQRVRNDTERMNSYAKPVQDKIKDIADKAGLESRIGITRCYRHLYYPKADKANSHLRHHELPMGAQGEQEKNQTQVIQQTLEQLGKIKDTPVATDFLAKVAGFPKTDPVSTSQAVEGFWRDHDVGVFLNPNRLTEAIAAGVKNGQWVYYDSESEKAYDASTPVPSVQISSSTYLYSKGSAESHGLLKRDPTWADIERELVKAKGELGGVELRSNLETALGNEPTKTVIADILGRVLKQDPTPVVVVDGKPSGDSKPLPASAVAKLALERLTLLSRDRADKIGITVSSRPSGFTLAEDGAPGPVFGTLGDQLTELGEGKKIREITINKVTTQSGTGELKLLLAALPMLPKMDFEVRLDASGSYTDLNGSVRIDYLAGASVDFRKIEKEVLGLLDKAHDVTAELILTHRSADGMTPADDAWQRLKSTIADVGPGEIRVEVSGE